MKQITRTLGLGPGRHRPTTGRPLLLQRRPLNTTEAKDSSAASSAASSTKQSKQSARLGGAGLATVGRRQQSTTRPNFLASAAAPSARAAPVDDDDEELRLDEAAANEVAANEVAAKQDGGQLESERLDDCAAHRFADRHIGPRDFEIGEMLTRLGYESLDELINQTVPAEIRFGRQLQLGPALSEHELVEQLRALASENSANEWRSFIGLGYYDCVTPAVIQRNMFESPGWTTAYTAYQAEIAQGRLESLMNFQTMVSDLTGLDVANASLLDEATAAAEAMQVCVRVDKRRRQRFLMSRNCHPQTKAVLETRAKALGIQVDQFDELELLAERGPRAEPDFSNYCGLLLQYPNTEGHLYDLGQITGPCHSADCLAVVATDLMACTLFKPPGDFDEPADLVVGSAQRFGVPLNFGGPHAGFLACRQKLIRSIPGRVVGLTRDSAGNRAYRFALQTREQHIRRDKATSNICTAQALLANMSAMYAIYHGPQGLRNIASSIHLKASLLAQLVEEAPLAAGQGAGPRLANRGAYFDTLTFEFANQGQLDEARVRAKAAKLNLRYHPTRPALSLSLDETTRLADVFRLAQALAPAAGPAAETTMTKTKTKTTTTTTTTTTTPPQLKAPIDNELSSLKRNSDFLTHPTFNRYHSETKLLRYMKQLENKDISLAHSMIPLGSCTMKLNATSQMLASSWPEFARLHPFQPLDQCQGYLRLFRELDEQLCEITGYDRFSFQPNSGAQGEYAGLRVIRAYLDSIGQGQRDLCLIPISAHGTNPASAQMAGFRTQSIRVLEDGNIDMEDFASKVEQSGDKLACLMVTYPSTFGVFEERIGELCALVHEAGGQVYLDGANMNAQVGLCRPGDYGSDVSHLNLHKTFCIPHGGGGPGAGPIGVKRHLIPFLPDHPLVSEQGGRATAPESFGTVSACMWGSPAILPISWAYIRLMSGAGLRRASELAILNANYMRKRLENDFKILYRGSRGNVAHEFILDCRPFKRSANVEANDIAKRLQDFGFHAPTVSWPVGNTLMLEPTESEDKQQLDNYCDALLAIRQEIRQIESGQLDRELNPIKMAPHTQQVVCSDSWARPYGRAQAAFPASFVSPGSKVWPTVGRVDDTFGDTNLFCSCPPPSAPFEQ